MLRALASLLLLAGLSWGLDWRTVTTNFRMVTPGNYNSFYRQADGKVVVFNNVAPSVRQPDYGPYNWSGLMSRAIGPTTGTTSYKIVIRYGPDRADRNQFRAAAVARGDASHYWALIEANYQYASGRPYYRLAYSSPDGFTWTYLGDMTLDGNVYHTQDGSVGLIYQPGKTGGVNVYDISENRYIYLAAYPLRIAVSADGVNFLTAITVPVASMFPSDSPTFPSFARTPYGWHVLWGDNWAECCGVRYWRHVFSPDLRTWKVLERASPAKVQNNYKTGTVHYEASTNRLWILGVAGETTGNKLLWLTAKAF